MDGIEKERALKASFKIPPEFQFIHTEKLTELLKLDNTHNNKIETT